jgi:hypothetical protein
MLERILGTITFKASTYRTTASDKDALKQAGILVMVVVLLQSLFGILKGMAEIGTRASLNETILSLVLNIILGLLIWVIIAWLLAVIASAFGGRRGLKEMLCVTGFVQVFGLLSVLSLLSLIKPGMAFLDPIVALVIAVLCVIGYYLVAREVAGLSTGKALLTAILASVGGWIVIFLIDRIAGTVLPGLLWYIHFIG